MTSKSLVKLSGIALLLSGILATVGFSIHPHDSAESNHGIWLGDVVLMSGGLLNLLGLVGLYLVWAASLGLPLDAAGVTKGALYHHFDNKEALGYALVDEVILGLIRDKWFRPLQSSENPIDALVGVVESTSLAPEHIQCGCPLNNLAQEMSPLDEGFRKRLAKIFNEWHDGMAAALREGQKRGLVRRDVDPDETATFLMAANEGCWSLAKNSQDVRVLQSGMRSMIRYLESLRAPRGRSRPEGSG